jgi:transcriptional regulator with XRE-family HTH domain
MTTPSGDELDWVRRYREDYLTLDELAKLMGITSREGASRRLERMGVTPRTPSETKQLRKRRDISLWGNTIRQTFLETRTVCETASLLGLGETLVREALQELVPDFQVLARVSREVISGYSEDDLLSSLKEAAESVPGNLTAASYEIFARQERKLQDGRRRPSGTVISHHFGSWAGAIEAAGLPASHRPGQGKKFSAADSISAVAECWRQVDAPTLAAYGKWQQGQADKPSAATVKQALGSWDLMLLQAWQLVHAEILNQEDEDTVGPGRDRGDR